MTPGLLLADELLVLFSAQAAFPSALQAFIGKCKVLQLLFSRQLLSVLIKQTAAASHEPHINKAAAVLRSCARQPLS